MRSNQFAHERTVAAPAAHTRYLSSPAAATLHGETQGFVLRLPQQNKAHATFMQPVQCILKHSLHHHLPSSPLPKVTTLPSSPLSQVTTLPSSPVPLVTTSQSHHTPFVTTSLRHHFPSSPLPFVTTSLSHHCPSSPPCVIAYDSFVMYCYVMSSLTPPCHSLLFFCDVLLFDVKSDSALQQCQFFVMYCYVMPSLTPPFINVNFL